MISPLVMQKQRLGQLGSYYTVDMCLWFSKLYKKLFDYNKPTEWLAALQLRPNLILNMSEIQYRFYLDKSHFVTFVSHS